MSTIASTDLATAVEDAAAYLYVWALKDIPQDLRDALRDAIGARDPQGRPARSWRRSTPTSRSPTSTATWSARTPASPSSTSACGERFPLHPARIEVALREGTRRATLEHPLRSNTVHTLTRKATGDNTGHRIPTSTGSSCPTGTAST